MRGRSEVSVRDGEAMLILYSIFRGKGQTLILIYHMDVFAPGIWHDGLFGRWSEGSLISDSQAERRTGALIFIGHIPRNSSCEP